MLGDGIQEWRFVLFRQEPSNVTWETMSLMEASTRGGMSKGVGIRGGKKVGCGGGVDAEGLAVLLQMDRIYGLVFNSEETIL